MPNITTNHATTNTNNKKDMFKKEARCGGRVARESRELSQPQSKLSEKSNGQILGIKLIQEKLPKFCTKKIKSNCF